VLADLGFLSGAEVGLCSADVIHLRLSDKLYATLRSYGHPDLIMIAFFDARTHRPVLQPEGVYLDGPFGQATETYEGHYALVLAGNYTLGVRGGTAYVLRSGVKVSAVREP
jgi:hypothetical protein